MANKKVPARRNSLSRDSRELMRWLAEAVCGYAMDYFANHYRAYDENSINPEQKSVQIAIVDEARAHFEDFLISTKDKVAALMLTDNRDCIQAELLMCAREYGLLVAAEVEKQLGPR